jgi:type IV pilus assembly protein PilV
VNARHPAQRPERSRGFTLVEAMVALLVLSIGLLGIAALFIESLKAMRTSVYRTQAVNLATDLADRMRANRLPANAYDCGGACAAAEGGNAVAIADINAWITSIAAELPSGAGGVTYTAATAVTPDIYVISVTWTEVGQAAPIAYQLRVEI